MNIYCDPEKFGLTILCMMDTGASYEFDMLVVWQDRDGNVYYAEDSGCSCPAPFSGHGLDSLIKITEHDFLAFENHVYHKDAPLYEKLNLIQVVAKAMEGGK